MLALPGEDFRSRVEGKPFFCSVVLFFTFEARLYISNCLLISFAETFTNRELCV